MSGVTPVVDHHGGVSIRARVVYAAARLMLRPLMTYWPLNPLGLKGAGEGGANAVGAAIAAAIDDALGMPGAVTQLPVTPQRLRAILRARKPA